MSQAAKDWTALGIGLLAIVVLGSFNSTSKFARYLSIFLILVLLLRGDAVTRLQNFVSSLGG